MTDKLTIRDVDPDDLEILKAAARDKGTSLNKYVTAVLHEQARKEHHRRLFAAIADQGSDPAVEDFDAVAEVRAMRDEQDDRDSEHGHGKEET